MRLWPGRLPPSALLCERIQKPKLIDSLASVATKIRVENFIFFDVPQESVTPIQRGQVLNELVKYSSGARKSSVIVPAPEVVTPIQKGQVFKDLCNTTPEREQSPGLHLCVFSEMEACDLSDWERKIFSGYQYPTEVLEPRDKASYL